MANRIEHTLKERLAGVKRKIGEVIGSDRMRAEGRSQELEHGTKKDAAKAKQNLQGKGQELFGKAKGAVADMTDDRRMGAEGRAKELEGQARQKLNEPS